MFADDIINAIENYNLIRVWYVPGSRIVEPQALGRSADRNQLMRAFQTEGASSSGKGAHWTIFRVDQIRSLEVLTAKFHRPRSDYKRGDAAMRGGIIKEL
jgi:hypothetical protein